MLVRKEREGLGAETNSKRGKFAFCFWAEVWNQQLKTSAWWWTRGKKEGKCTDTLGREKKPGIIACRMRVHVSEYWVSVRREGNSDGAAYWFWLTACTGKRWVFPSLNPAGEAKKKWIKQKVRERDGGSQKGKREKRSISVKSCSWSEVRERSGKQIRESRTRNSERIHKSSLFAWNIFDTELHKYFFCCFCFLMEISRNRRQTECGERKER